MSQTIAHFLNVKEFPFEIKNHSGNLIYFEDQEGYWFKKIFDLNNNPIYYKDSYGFWYEQEFDSNGNITCYKNSEGTITYYQSPYEDKIVEIEGVKYKLSKL